jgi:hypothetical protein
MYCPIIIIIVIIIILIVIQRVLMPDLVYVEIVFAHRLNPSSLPKPKSLGM